MKNYVIVAIIIILIIVGVVWFKMKTPAPVMVDETSVVTEPAPADDLGLPVDETGAPVDTSDVPAAQ